MPKKLVFQLDILAVPPPVSGEWTPIGFHDLVQTHLRAFDEKSLDAVCNALESGALGLISKRRLAWTVIVDGRRWPIHLSYLHPSKNYDSLCARLYTVIEHATGLEGSTLDEQLRLATSI